MHVKPNFASNHNNIISVHNVNKNNKVSKTFFWIIYKDNKSWILIYMSGSNKCKIYLIHNAQCAQSCIFEMITINFRSSKFTKSNFHLLKILFLLRTGGASILFHVLLVILIKLAKDEDSWKLDWINIVAKLKIKRFILHPLPLIVGLTIIVLIFQRLV